MIPKLVPAPAWFALALALGVGPGSNAWGAEKTRRNVEIEWEAVPDATLYEVRLQRRNSRGTKFLNFKLTAPKWSANIAPGPYVMQIRSYDDRGVPGQWGPMSDLLIRLPSVPVTNPKEDVTIRAKDDREEPVHFTWEMIEGAKTYRVHIESTTGDHRVDREVGGTELTETLPVAQNYVWSVAAVDPKNQAGEAAPRPPKFQLEGPTLSEPNLKRPDSEFVREVEWAPTPFVKSYRYVVEYRDHRTKTWSVIESADAATANRVVVPVERPTGRYRVSVQALGERRPTSAKSTIEFRRRGGFRDENEFEREELRASIVKPTPLYAIFSYLLSDVQYTFDDRDTNLRSKFSGLGGTGRVGLGYQKPASGWGYYGVVDVGGFTIGGQNFTSTSGEVHVTRRLELGQKGVLLVGAGVFSKSLPAVVGNYQSDFSQIEKIQMLGPHAGALYWLPLTKRFGVQANARAYLGMLGSNQLQPSLSYQMGLLGSYHLSRSWMGLAGIAVRDERANFKATGHAADPKSFAGPGDISTIELNGTFMNFQLEYNF